MFCSQCGTQLLDGAKFCSTCGAPVALIQSSPQPSVVPNVSGITVPILDSSVSLPPNIQESGKIFNEFRDLAVRRAKAHTAAFSSNYANLDAFVSKSNQLVGKIYEEFYQKSLDYLKSQGIFSYDMGQIVQASDKYTLLWKELYQSVRADYSRLEKSAEREIAQRERRKENRGKVVGGGFSLKGAVKGMMTAGAINAATGAAHSAFNSVGDTMTNLGLSIEKNFVLKDPSVRNKIENAIIYDCTHIYYGLLELYNKARPNAPLPIYSDEDYRKASNIYRSIQEKGISSDHLAVAVLEMLQTFPISEDFYRLAVQSFPDEEDAFRMLAGKCGISLQKRRFGDDAKRYEIAHRLCQNSFFQETAATPTKANFLELLAEAAERHRNDLGKRIYVYSDPSTPGYAAAKKRLRKREGEVPYLCIDTSLFGSSEGKKGILITNQALYGSENWPRKPLETLDPCIARDRLYFERKDVDSSKAEGTSEMIYDTNDVHGNATDGTIMSNYICFVVDMLRFKALSSTDGGDFISEIISMDEQDYEGFVSSASANGQIDTHTAQVDALVAEILQSSLLESQKKQDFGQYLLPCGTRCPAARRSQLEDLMNETGVPNSEDELELLFGVGAMSKRSGIFLLTNKALYTPKHRIALQEIETLEVKGKLLTSIIVNGIEIVCPYDTQIRQEFCHDLKAKIIPLMKERFG